MRRLRSEAGLLIPSVFVRDGIRLTGAGASVLPWLFLTAWKRTASDLGDRPSRPFQPRSVSMAKGQQQPKQTKKPKLSIKERQDKKKAKAAAKGAR